MFDKLIDTVVFLATLALIIFGVIYLIGGYLYGASVYDWIYNGSALLAGMYLVRRI